MMLILNRGRMVAIGHDLFLMFAGMYRNQHLREEEICHAWSS